MNKMKNAGRIIMLIGTVCIFSAMGILCFNLYSQKNAEKYSSEVLQKLDTAEYADDATETPDYVLNPYMELPKKNIDGTDYAGIISIPSLSITLPVNADCNEDNLRLAPCVYEGTPYREKMIIAGHNYKTHFGPIDNLVSGDTVVFKDFDGNKFSYKVIYTEIIDENDIEKMNGGDWDLSLFTCTYSGAQRITVRCKLTE